jgi:transketolase
VIKESNNVSSDIVNELAHKANTLRRQVLQIIYEGGSGHCGGSLSAIDIMNVLYFHTLNLKPAEPLWPERDRFILSKGHACPALYAILAMRDFFPASELQTFRQINSRLRGHPEYGLPGVETVTGSLGQGFSVALGMAMGLQRQKAPQRVYCLLGDGETQEGMVWEAAMTAGHFNLANLTCFLDNNRLQGDGPIKEIMDIEPLADKWRAFNWQVQEIDGHDIQQIIDAISWAQSAANSPQIIIAHTVKGKGVSFMEDVATWHGTEPPTKEQLATAMHDLDIVDLHLRSSKND